MKLLKRFLTAFVIFISTCAVAASDFHIEDPALKPVPRAINKLLYQQPGAKDSECKGFIGLPIALDGGSAKSDWIAITSNGCAWGASSASIWIVQKIKNDYRLVLSSGGYSVTLGLAKQNGLKHLAVSAGTAGYYSESLFKFDGTRYLETKNRSIDLSVGSDDCKKPENKDVCR